MLVSLELRPQGGQSSGGISREREEKSIRGCDQRGRTHFTQKVPLILRTCREARSLIFLPEQAPVRFDDAWILATEDCWLVQENHPGTEELGT